MSTFDDRRILGTGKTVDSQPRATHDAVLDRSPRRFLTSRPATSRLLAFVGALAFVVVLAGCGESKSSSTPTSTATSATSTPASSAVTLSVKSLPTVGTVLVDSNGRALYTFAPDKHVSVTCTGACAQVWPPLKLAGGQQPVAGTGVKASLLASAPDPEGGRVVTYGGWPLYTYVADSSGGPATGQALDINGGLWYVISPSGQVVKK
jgi:predicted lipoprotein with Yx(FWY)xxD motif